MSFNEITHIIFDLDGLLLDTERIYTDIFQEIAKSFGKEFTYEIKWKQMGKSMQEAAAIFIDELNIQMTIEEYCLKIPKLVESRMTNVPLMPGAEKLIYYFKTRIPMAIATGSSLDEYILKTKKHFSLFNCFKNVVCTTGNPEVKRGKPHPDVFLLALDKFEQPPLAQNVLVFEDAPNGVEAALTAGMSVVWVPSPQLFTQIQNSPNKFPVPTLMIRSLEEFDPQKFGL